MFTNFSWHALLRMRQQTCVRSRLFTKPTRFLVFFPSLHPTIINCSAEIGVAKNSDFENRIRTQKTEIFRSSIQVHSIQVKEIHFKQVLL